MSKIIRTEKPSVLHFMRRLQRGWCSARCCRCTNCGHWRWRWPAQRPVFLAARRVCPPQVILREVPFHTGSGDVDQMLADIQQKLDTLHALNDALPDPELSAAMDRMEKAGRSIIEVVEAAPAKAKQVRRFANYYLPDAVHVLEQYAAMARQGCGAKTPLPSGRRWKRTWAPLPPPLKTSWTPSMPRRAWTVGGPGGAGDSDEEPGPVKGLTCGMNIEKGRILYGRQQHFEL